MNKLNVLGYVFILMLLVLADLQRQIDVFTSSPQGRHGVSSETGLKPSAAWDALYKRKCGKPGCSLG